jgi:hypothetical protein
MYAPPGQRAEVCARHRRDAYVDVVSRRCIFEGPDGGAACHRQALFGYPADGRPKRVGPVAPAMLSLPGFSVLDMQCEEAAGQIKEADAGQDIKCGRRVFCGR